MKILKYLYKGNQVELGWNEINEEVARREADDGQYTIEEDGQPEPGVKETADDVINALLGVTE